MVVVEAHWKKQDLDHLTFRHSVLSTESLKLARAQNPPPDSTILADVSPFLPR